MVASALVAGPSQLGNVMEAGLRERFESWAGKRRRREFVIRAFGVLEPAQAQGALSPARSASRRRLLEANRLPTDGLIKLEFQREFEGLFAVCQFIARWTE